MSFNLFGPASKSDIRVGYIDPERGFVGNLTVYEANRYAKLNPGTCLLYTSPSPRDQRGSRMPSSA